MPSSGSFFCDSGVEHQQQCSGQPLNRTRVRSPGPLCIVIRVILRTSRLSLSFSGLLSVNGILPAFYFSTDNNIPLLQVFQAEENGEWWIRNEE
jgi:hypothetical protein